MSYDPVPGLMVAKTFKCPVCFSERRGGSFVVYDDRYGYPGRFEVVRCASCGHRRLNRDFTSEDLSVLYTDYYPRASFDAASHRPHSEASGFSAWLSGERRFAFRWVPPGVRVLDIGCGSGEALGYFESRGCEAHGVEADANAMKFAEKFGYKIKIGLFDPKMFEPGYFDFVTMDQVIEHALDPFAMLSGVAKVLKPGGFLILSTPNAKGWGIGAFESAWINWHAPYHLHFFSRRSMARVAARTGFSVEMARTVTSSDWLDYQWAHLITRPREGEKSKFWNFTGGYTASQKLLLKASAVLRKFKINHALTRAFDAAGLGDNLLFVLRKTDEKDICFASRP